MASHDRMAFEEAQSRLSRIMEAEGNSPVAPDADAIPPRIDAITADWLTVVLCQRHRGAFVTGLDIVGGSDGTTSRRALTVSYNDVGVAAGLPTRVFMKITASLQSRLICGLSEVMFHERNFYVQVRPRLNIEAPIAHHAAADRETFRSILLLNDLAVAGCRFLTPYDSISRPMAESMTRLLADLHASTWRAHDDPGIPKFPTSVEHRRTGEQLIGFRERSHIGIERAAAVIPNRLRADKDRLWDEGLMASLRENVRLPMSILHSDVHVGNWYQTAAGEMGLSDWQCVNFGNGSRDLAYMLSCGLSIEDRRAWEAELVGLYAAELARHGVPDDVSYDTQWRRYREQLFHGFYSWVYTIGAGDTEPDMQPDDFSLINIERIATALDDHGTLQLLQRL